MHCEIYVIYYIIRYAHQNGNIDFDANLLPSLHDNKPFELKVGPGEKS